MKTTVFLVRHGEIDNPKDIIYGRDVDLKLSLKGINQISALAKKLDNLDSKISKIYSSPLLRARQSSDILFKILKLKGRILIEDNFTDADMPALVGKPMKLLRKMKRMGTDQYQKKYIKLGNESSDHVIKRVKNAFFKILKSNQGKTIIILSHGDPIRFLLFCLLNPGKKVPPIIKLAKEFFPAKGSAVRLVLENGRVLEKEYIS